MVLLPLLRAILTVLLSLITAAVLSVLALALFPHLSRVLERVEQKTGLDLSKQLLLATFGGIIGGIAFAIVSPIVVPTINDTQVQTGLVEKPEPTIKLDCIPSYPNRSTKIEFNKTWEPDYRVCTLYIQNTHRRPINDFGSHIYFPDGIEARSVRGTMRFLPVGMNQELEFPSDRNFGNESFQDQIRVDQIPPGKVAMVSYLLDTEPEGWRKQPPVSGTNIRSDEILLSTSYNWNYRGRLYVEGRAFEKVTESNFLYSNATQVSEDLQLPTEHPATYAS